MTDRRHSYPFTNCTDCGPRFTIVEGVPYDRARTTMHAFTMCPECRAEYEDLRSWRFHAEPNACPACGPRIWLARTGECPDVKPDASCPDPIAEAARLLDAGKVSRSRARRVPSVRRAKRRPGAARLRRSDGALPFAIMVPRSEEAERHCRISAAEREWLPRAGAPDPTARAPFGFGDRRIGRPRQRSLGVMLPTRRSTGFSRGRAAGARDDKRQPERRANCARQRRGDASPGGHGRRLPLLHDRAIQTPCDDSVARVFRAS